MHKFSKNPGPVSKFWSPVRWHSASSLPSAHKY